MELRKKNRILGRISLVIFSLSMIIGIAATLEPDTNASGIIIILMGVVGIILSFVDKIVLKIFKKDAPFSVLLFANVFVFLATFPGEILGAYYRLWWWGVFLHLFSGAGVTYIVFRIIEVIFRESESKLSANLVVLFSLLISLSGAVIWETIEFSIDSIFNTNMQKFIPAEFLSEDVGSVTELNASDEQIVEFYSKPKGYRFALMDTMEDHACYMLGALAISGGLVIKNRVKKLKSK